MTPLKSSWHLSRAALPAGIFFLLILLHVAWTLLFPERDPSQSEWADFASPGFRESLVAYGTSGSFWLGISYAIPGAFAVAAFRRYREERSSGARTLAVGGLTLSGGLGVAGCFLVGCCGSPMLAVYASLFGTRFLALARPLVALISLASVTVGWWWLERRSKRCTSEGAPAACACGPTECGKL